ncbi:MAG: helix-turn-helix transcriptional regulator [Bacteroidales bacterium]|nr:helix-turn-helix transcriptional regulator [Bacteroidales bacterium]
MIKRIEEIMRSENMAQNKFAEEIGITASRLSHYLSGRNGVSLELVTKILERFRGINYEWMLFGRGPMYKTTQEVKRTSFENDLFSSVNVAPQVEKPLQTENNAEKFDDSVLTTETKHSETFTEPENVENITPKHTEKQVDSTPRMARSKSIEKILVLYEDGSFDCYLSNGKKI